MMTPSCSRFFLLRALRRMLVAVALLPGISYAANWDIDQLMRGLAQIRSGHASLDRKSVV